MGKYSFDKNNRCQIENYNETFPFANFLPGISGIWGIPLWIFYVNRGQCVISMGIKDKNHSILEFFPADRAYQLAPTLSFRTFIKINNSLFYEPFRLTSVTKKKEKLIISSYDLTLEEKNYTLDTEFFINYFALPNMPFGALVRILKIKNTSKKKRKLEILDGLPRVIPFGAREIFIKHLSRTIEAWMDSGIENVQNKEIALFKLKVDPRDTSSTSYIEGANFFFSFYEKEKKVIQPKIIVDAQKIFAHDLSFYLPINFLDKKFRYPKNQLFSGKTPCSFSFMSASLAPNTELTLYTLMGSVFKKEMFTDNIKIVTPSFIESKREENRNVIENIKGNTLCVSAYSEFNEYIKCSYLDNILRGGYPYKFDNNKVYYLFSRKHGDLERDYNKFKFLPSYFSEGETNYRDINQNRRTDLFFNPYIYHKNIVYFMNLLRIDGYNPLLVRGEKLYFESEGKIREILQNNSLPADSNIILFMKKGFYLGEICNYLERAGVKVKDRDRFVENILEEAAREPKAKFGDGFWIDHWHYNLDLIENFLYFYPDRKEELFLKTEFMFWDDEVRVKERAHRYILKDGKVYQLNCLEKVSQKKEILDSRDRFRNFLRVNYGKGEIYKTHLIEKMLSLILNKLSTLDFEGVGIEMEADKPGWCDSLNGLPSVFGSSLCETLELKRAAVLLKEAVTYLGNKGNRKISISQELFEFFICLEELLDRYLRSRSKRKDFFWWGESNRIKENFREKTFWGIEGKQRGLSLEKINNFLNKTIKKLELGIKKGRDKKSGIYFSYFMYKVCDYKVDTSGCITIKKATRESLPLFLEAPMHTLRVSKEQDLPRKVEKSPLYDKKLKMYRLNASLQNTSLEIGRSRVFPRGWLENESIWLHMEYKYLLEMLKSDQYERFYRDFFKCLVCFFKPQVYGRNILENSSFIVSSVHFDPSLWGKGFVARLTGATSEILNIWILMCLGTAPFFIDDKNNLHMKFAPILKKELFTTTSTAVTIGQRTITFPPNIFAFKLFSSILVVYHNPKRKDTYSKDIKIKKIEVKDDHQQFVLTDSVIPPPLSYDIREARVKEIRVYFG